MNKLHVDRTAVRALVASVVDESTFLHRLGGTGGRMKEARMGLDQIDPPILHRMRHYTDLTGARCSGLLA
jgi:hypothetical protein